MASIPTSMPEREGSMWPAGERVSCWQCGVEHAANLFCPACDAIQPLPEQADYFQVFGLPRRLIIDSSELEKRFYELHRRLHPDRYQTSPQVARVASLRNTATLNRAYSMLRDPLDRGLYWLALHGESLGSNNNRVPAEMAALVFDVQEKLEELRAGHLGNGHAALVTEVGEVRGELRERHAALLDQLQANFARWDGAGADKTVLMKELKTTLSALSYLGTLLRDVDKELES